MIFSLDKYYSTTFYNKIIETLKKKKVQFEEFINVKNYQFYIKTKLDPVILDYEKLYGGGEFHIVKKVKTLNPNEEYLYSRIKNQTGSSALEFAKNDYMKYFNTMSFIILGNHEEAVQLSKKVGRVYYAGRYMGRWNLYVIDGRIKHPNILANGKPLECELKLNYIFAKKDMLEKYTQTPFWEFGVYHQPNQFASFFYRK